MSKKRNRKTQSRAAMSTGPRASAGKIPDDFNPDYTYVKKDLRTIGILASIFITILVVLSFLL